MAWYSTVGDEMCPDTGMWMVEPDYDATGSLVMPVVHLDTILRSVHLMGIAGDDFIPKTMESKSDLLKLWLPVSL